MARTRATRKKEVRPARRPRRTDEQIARDKATDDAHVVIHNLHRDSSIDKLLCLPLDAIRTGVAFGIRREEFDQDEGDRFVTALRKLFDKHPQIDAAVKEFCRTAMAARKRGSLKRDRV